MNTIVVSSTLNFADRCEIFDIASTTQVWCYSPATSFVMLLLVIGVFGLSMLIFYKIFKGKHLGV